MIAEHSENACSGVSDPARTPEWMKRTLKLAAAYNLLWGAVAIVAPTASLGWLGIDPAPLYPEFWQCLGMVIGVYGIGYAIAARNPCVHWPIVLVGLLGKIFGPIGFAVAVLRGRLPASMSWTILTNDLIWWAPFGLILWHAAREHQGSTGMPLRQMADRVLDPLGRFVSQSGSTIRELSRRKPLMLVFLRHSGCTFCREALGDIAAQRQQIEANGIQIALVHMGQHEPEELLQKYGLSDLHRFRDPQCLLYDTFGLKAGSPLQLFGPKVWWRGVRAWMEGHGLGSLDGDGFRLGGVFIVRRGDVVMAHRLSSAADRPNYVELSKAVAADSSRQNSLQSSAT
jgi:hypothetical protein